MDATGVDLLEVGNAVLFEALLCNTHVFYFECQMIGQAADRLPGFLGKIRILNDMNLDTVVIEPSPAEVERRSLDLISY